MPVAYAQLPGFVAPDTVCVGDPITISHVPTASKYLWNFCAGGFYNIPDVTNLGTTSGFNVPVFMVTEKQNGNFYGYVSNNTGSIVKLNFGNSLLNTPTSVLWGDCNGVIPNHTEKLQMVQDVNGYHLIVVGGLNETVPQIVRVDLGTDLSSNATPSGVSWGNIGNLDYPTGLYVFSDNNHWYGFVTNWNNNSITRFDFGADFSNPPAGVNLGGIGGLSHPTGICALQENGKWYVCVGNEADGTITRLDFGTSLLNTPVATNMGNAGGVITSPRDLTIVHDCGGTFGLTVDHIPSNTLVKLNFEGGLEGTLKATDLGNVGNLNFPHSLTTLFREGENLYSFITNAYSNSLSRVVFSSCSEATIPNSTAAVPPQFSYTKAGIYTVNVMVDETLPSEATYCKSIVVLDKPVAPVVTDKTVCVGGQVTLDATEPAANGITHYTWDNGTPGPVVTVGAGQYKITVGNGGCATTSGPITVKEETIDPQPTSTPDNCSNGAGWIVWNPSGGKAPYTATLQGNPVTGNYAPNLAAGTYNLVVKDAIGCTASASVAVTNTDINCAGASPAPAYFSAPDTVCVNTPINLTGISTNNTYFWNFCSGGFYSTPVVTNLGNPGGLLTTPTFSAFAKEGPNWYGFVINNTQHIERLSFGNSLLNTPVASTYGSLGGQLTTFTEGMQLVKDGAGWHLLVVGGSTPTTSIIQRIDLGPSLAANFAPVVSTYGNIGGMDYPTDIYAFQENGQWHAFTTNFFNNTLTRFDFGTSFSNMPTAVNLGNLGGMEYPAGVCAVQDGGNWYVFVANRGSYTDLTGSAIIRLDFGNSLLNTPTAVNLGNPGNTLARPRDLTIMHDCGGVYGLVVNETTNDIVKLNFNQGIAGPITATSLGNLGNLAFPHSVSNMFREGNDLYAFITNVNNSTLSRVDFQSCTASSIPSSTAAQPASFSYQKAGTYTVNMLTDESLPSQNSYCKNIVVLDAPVLPVLKDSSICYGIKIDLDATVAGTTNRYAWSNGAGTPAINVGGGNYTVTVDNGGCSAQQSVTVTEDPQLQLTGVTQSLDCLHPEGGLALQGTGGTGPYQYMVNELGTAPVSVPLTKLAVGTYTTYIKDAVGCETPAQLFTVLPNPAPLKTAITGLDPACPDVAEGSIQVNVVSGGIPGDYQYSLNGETFQPMGSWNSVAAGDYQVVTRSEYCLDTTRVTIKGPATIYMQAVSMEENCGDGTGAVRWNPSGGTGPYNITWEGNLTTTNSVMNLHSGDYFLHLEDANGCVEDTLVTVNNNTTSRIHIINEDTTINIGESILLVAENNAPDYQWSPAGSVQCAGCAATLATPLQPTQYVVKTLTGRNCISADTVNVNLTYNEGLVVPNAFSPNGDGHNDTFLPMSLGIYEYHITIFNRWGNVIFDSKTSKQGWDGTFKNQYCDVDTYVYMIEYSYFSNPQRKLLRKGVVSLVR